jgi:hypothetical protein
MADDPLNLNPPVETIEPRPIDAVAWQKSHDEHMATMSEHNPDSPVYRRPDLAVKYRQDAQLKFDALCLRAGVTFKPDTPQIVAERDEAARWSFSTMPEAWWIDIDAKVAATAALPAMQREANVADMQRRFGETEWQHQADVGRPPTMDRRAFIAAEGQRQYEQMVKAAAEAKPNLPKAAFEDEHTLKMLASVGRYKQGMAANRRKF